MLAKKIIMTMLLTELKTLFIIETGFAMFYLSNILTGVIAGFCH